MRNHDEIYTKIRELEKRYQTNCNRQEALRRQTRAVDWADSEEGKEYASLEKLNSEIMHTISGLRWTLDNSGDNPYSQMVEALASGQKALLHKGKTE